MKVNVFIGVSSISFQCLSRNICFNLVQKLSKEQRTWLMRWEVGMKLQCLAVIWQSIYKVQTWVNLSWGLVWGQHVANVQCHFYRCLKHLLSFSQYNIYSENPSNYCSYIIALCLNKVFKCESTSKNIFNFTRRRRLLRISNIVKHSWHL